MDRIRTATVGTALCLTMLCLTALSLTGPILAADLSAINRSIAKLPQLTSPAPEYCLLVFGPEAAKRVWLVHDGDVLYVDRNGNGALTEDGERVAAEPKVSEAAEDVYFFQVGEIPDVPRSHKDLQVRWMKIDHLREFEQYRALIERVVKIRGCVVSVDVAIEGQHGTGLEGRVSQSATIADSRGLLRFAASPEIAPIVHFGGPWEITLSGPEQWRVGRSKEVTLNVGTPGLGAGTTAAVAFGKVIPPALAPRLQVSFPPAEGQAAIEQTFELTRRCCGYNLYGDILVPPNVGPGSATVEISLESWPGAFVASTTHAISFMSAKPGPKLEPVSSRLTSKLQHDHPRTSIAEIRFSPDGNRVIAGDYPGGVIHVWDLASGKQLTSSAAGEGFRGSMDYFSISPDWKTLFALKNTRGTFDHIERDGKNCTA
jgi:hypothetical protein